AKVQKLFRIFLLTKISHNLPQLHMFKPVDGETSFNVTNTLYIIPLNEQDVYVLLFTVTSLGIDIDYIALIPHQPLILEVERKLTIFNVIMIRFVLIFISH